MINNVVLASKWGAAVCCKRYSSDSIVIESRDMKYKSNTTSLRDNFPGFACWGDLILNEFQNQFCSCSAQIG